MMSVLPFSCLCNVAAAAVLVYCGGAFLCHHPFPIIFCVLPSFTRKTGEGKWEPLLAKFLHTLLFQNTHTKATPANGEETGMG